MPLEPNFALDRPDQASGLLAPLLAVAALALAWQMFPGPWTPLMLALGLVVVVLAWFQPALPALVCIAFSAFRLQEAYPVLHPYQLPLLTAAWSALGLAMAVARGRLSISSNPMLLSTLTLVLWTSVACFASTDAESSVFFWTESFVKIVFVTGVLAVLIRSDQEFIMLQGMVIGCGAALGIATVWNHVIGAQLVEQTRVTIGRDLGSPLGDPNDLALMLAIALAFALAALASARSAGTWLALAAITLLIGFSISLTQSRGGLLAVVALLLTVAGRRIPSKSLVVLLCSGGGLILAVSMDLGGRTSGGRNEEGLGESAQLRLEFWKIALRQTLEHPLFGIGPQTFARIAGEFTGHAVTVHNTLIQSAVEAGLPGLAALASTLGCAALVNARAERYFEAQGRTHLQAAALGSQAALAAFCVAAMFLSQAFNWALYLALAPALALGFRLADERRASRPHPGDPQARTSDTRLHDGAGA